MNDDLRAGLDASADTYDIPPGDLDRVVGRARQRSRRRQRLSATCAALVLVAGTATALQLADGDDKTPVRADFASQLGDAGITWSRVDDPESSLGWLSSQTVVDVGDASYALSTAPGRADGGPRVLWRSDDGLEWRQVANPDELYLDDLDASDGQLYAIGTGPGTREPGGQRVPELRLGTSRAGSDEWTSRQLPIDTAAMAAATTDLYVVDQDVAAGPAGVVATVTLRGTVDARALLPGVEMPHGWTVDRDGITVLGTGEGCPDGDEPQKGQPEGEPGQIDMVWCGDRAVRSDPAAAKEARGIPAEEAYGIASRHTWADLGLPEAVVAAVLGTPFTFHADGPDGELTAIHPPLAADRLGGSTSVEAVDAGFVLLDSRQVDFSGLNALDVFRSTDGTTWTPDGTLGDLYGANAVGTVDGHLALVGQGQDGAYYAELGDGGWQTTSLGELVGTDTGSYTFVSAAGIGPLGVVVGLGEGDEDGTGYRLLASRDGETWQQDDLTSLLGGTTDRGVAQITIRGDRAVATIRTDIGDVEKTGRAAIVGTPR